MNAEELIHKLQALDTSTAELVNLAHVGRPLWSPEVWVEDANGYRLIKDVSKRDGGIYINIDDRLYVENDAPVGTMDNPKRGG